jgi:7-carboxy-7-deazaguanine synthase (Cx14CxxC type)
MTYSVKELFPTLQGEGRHAGRAAVFCRFAGCNLWSGREIHRERAICQFCDTDFVGTNGPGGGKFATAEQLADRIADLWSAIDGIPFVVFTGGEPALQLDAALIDALKKRHFEIAIETNGTLTLPAGIDWICVSPKANTRLVVTAGNELKLVFPQTNLGPSDVDSLEFEHFYLQPMDGPALRRNTELAVAYCLKHGNWRLSVQTHKVAGIP